VKGNDTALTVLLNRHSPLTLTPHVPALYLFELHEQQQQQEPPGDAGPAPATQSELPATDPMSLGIGGGVWGAVVSTQGPYEEQVRVRVPQYMLTANEIHTQQR
jgi:hypothetical protein